MSVPVFFRNHLSGEVPMNTLTSFLQSSLAADRSDILPFVWIGDENQAVCINPNSAKVFAILRHDGFRKYYPTLYVSIPTALHLLSQRAAFGLRLRNFSRCAVEVFRLKCQSMSQAQETIDELLTDLRIN
jgi:hypothetical protein